MSFAQVIETFCSTESFVFEGSTKNIPHNCRSKRCTNWSNRASTCWQLASKVEATCLEPWRRIFSETPEKLSRNIKHHPSKFYAQLVGSDVRVCRCGENLVADIVLPNAGPSVSSFPKAVASRIVTSQLPPNNAQHDKT